MDRHEARLLDRLKDYQKLQKEMQECIEDIDELLLIYDFDMDSITSKYPVLQTIKAPSKSSPLKRMRAFFKE